MEMQYMTWKKPTMSVNHSEFRFKTEFHADY